MPIYEYACAKCGHEFEQLVMAVEARDQGRCPECGDAGVTRKISVFAAREGEASSAGAADVGPCGRACGAGGSCPLGG